MRSFCPQRLEIIHISEGRFSNYAHLQVSPDDFSRLSSTVDAFPRHTDQNAPLRKDRGFPYTANTDITANRNHRSRDSATKGPTSWQMTSKLLVKMHVLRRIENGNNASFEKVRWLASMNIPRNNAVRTVLAVPISLQIRPSDIRCAKFRISVLASSDALLDTGHTPVLGCIT